MYTESTVATCHGGTVIYLIQPSSEVLPEIHTMFCPKHSDCEHACSLTISKCAIAIKEMAYGSAHTRMAWCASCGFAIIRDSRARAFGSECPYSHCLHCEIALPNTCPACGEKLERSYNSLAQVIPYVRKHFLEEGEDTPW